MGTQRQILHIDMNSFFASCEQVIHPELKNIPLIVGGDPETRRGIVLAASYEAKAYGVKTTMLIHEALRLCPTAVIVQSTHGLYSEMSKKVMTLFDDYTPMKQQVSIDEAFLDMTGTTHLFGPIEVAAKTIQERILKELDLPCSVGIAHNKLLAKMASDFKKPMGITTLYEDEIKEKLWPLRVGELYGIGRQTVPRLKEIGIQTIGDLATAETSRLIEIFGYKSGMGMHDSANGVGSDRVDIVIEPPKSIGNELTYAKDIVAMATIQEEVLLLSDKVGYRLRKKMLDGRTISIKLKYNDFTVITRAKTLEAPTHHTDIIYKVAMDLIRQSRGTLPIRLIGVTVTNFRDETNQQISFFDFETEPEHSEIDHMVDEIRAKFGYDMIKRGTLLDKKPPKQ